MAPRDDVAAAGCSTESGTSRFPPNMSQSKEEAEIRAMDVERVGIVNERELLRKFREPMVWFLALLSVLWLVGCAALLFLQGFSRFSHFSLPDSVLIAAITTTTANVLAMLVVVVKFIFPGRK